MDAPKIKAVLFTSKTYKDGTLPIMIRLTQNRKLLYTSVGHAVPADAWDEDAQRVYEKQPKITKRQEGQLNPKKLAEVKERYKHAIVLHNADTINSDIEDKLAEVAGINQKLKVNEESLDLRNIKNKLNEPEEGDRNKSFLAFGKGYRDNYLKAKSIGTYKRYKTVLFKLEEYLKKKDLLFADLTPQFLRDYEAYLMGKEDKPNKQSTINANMKAIRAIYYAAIAEQIIPADKNPFFVFKLKADNKVKKDKLTLEEVITIEGLKLKKDAVVWHVRNFFLFSFYCAGVRASDVLQLKWLNVSSEGRLEYHMEKTGQYKSVSLMPKAQAILQHYKTPQSKPDDYIFPFIDTRLNLKDSMVLFNQVSSCTALVNKYLKDIAKEAEIEKVLSTHIARHSFADIARKRKASIYDISKMLGHSSIKITEAYLASLDIDSQDETMNKVLDF